MKSKQKWNAQIYNHHIHNYYYKHCNTYTLKKVGELSPSRQNLHIATSTNILFISAVFHHGLTGILWSDGRQKRVATASSPSCPARPTSWTYMSMSSDGPQ